MIGGAVIFVAATMLLLAWVVMKMLELDSRQEELDSYSSQLDERANRLALWEQELNNRAKCQQAYQNPVLTAFHSKDE